MEWRDHDPIPGEFEFETDAKSLPSTFLTKNAPRVKPAGFSL